MKKESWNYSVWKAFNYKVYGEAITSEDLVDDGAEHFYEVVFKIDENRMLVEYTLDNPELKDVVLASKGKERYVIPSHLAEQMPFKVKAYFECQLKKADKKKWRFVTEIISLNIKGEETMPFKEFLNGWNNLEHSSPKHWTLLKMIFMASRHKGVKLGLCSEPSSGKNSNFTIGNHITRDMCRIQKPTLAKFETILYYNDVVLPDEITSLEQSKIRDIEPAILWIGDNSTEYNKHSMAQKSKMNNVDLIKKSLIFTYNRRQDLKNQGVFFDDIWSNPGAFKSRYPQLLAQGQVLEKLPNLNLQQAKHIMEDDFEGMRQFAKAFVYYTENLNKHLHGYKLPAFLQLNNRHEANLQGLFDIMDAYSDTELEYIEWIEFLKECLDNYKAMAKDDSVVYTEMQDARPQVEEKLKVTKMTYNRNNRTLTEVESDLI